MIDQTMVRINGMKHMATWPLKNPVLTFNFPELVRFQLVCHLKIGNY